MWDLNPSAPNLGTEAERETPHPATPSRLPFSALSPAPASIWSYSFHPLNVGILFLSFLAILPFLLLPPQLAKASTDRRLNSKTLELARLCLKPDFSICGLCDFGQVAAPPFALVSSTIKWE